MESQLEYPFYNEKQMVLVDRHYLYARSVWVNLKSDGLLDQHTPERIRRRYNHSSGFATQLGACSTHTYRSGYYAVEAAVMFRRDRKCRLGQQGGGVPECLASDTSTLQCC